MTIRKPYVLVVDDQAGIRMLLKEAFEIGVEDVKVETVASGDEAIEIVKKSFPDIIFLDLKMPKKDGIEVFLELKELGYNGYIVIMTGLEALDIEVDADYILCKPFDIQEAVEVLHQQIYKDTKIS